MPIAAYNNNPTFLMRISICTCRYYFNPASQPDKHFPLQRDSGGKIRKAFHSLGARSGYTNEDAPLADYQQNKQQNAVLILIIAPHTLGIPLDINQTWHGNSSASDDVY